MILRKKRSISEVPEEALIDRKTDAALQHPSDQTLNPEQNYSRIERSKMLRDNIECLRPSIRTAIEIRELQEHSVTETAKIMGISVAATKARVFHAKRILRKKLDRQALKQRRTHQRNPFALPARAPQKREGQMLQRTAA
jgi:DNA-directed RNA polymerase specialized sigma24 family protein